MKENIANKPMHNPPYVLGVIQAPDYHLEPELYSHFKATKEFNQISNDIFVQKQKAKPASDKKTPVGVICTFAAAALLVLYKIIKTAIFKK